MTSVLFAKLLYVMTTAVFLELLPLEVELLDTKRVTCGNADVWKTAVTNLGTRSVYIRVR